GWNNIYNFNSALFTSTKEHDHMYFVHSYYVDVNEYTIAEVSCEHNYSAALKKNNFYAVQFHPEKSGEAGQQILKNFLDL
ncbi:MAG: glutamine amidotransferase-related protein, partial [Flavipsychrobacter sp.]